MSLEPTTAKMSIPDLDSILKTCTAPMDTMIPASVEEVTKIIKESSKATCMLDPMPTALGVDYYIGVGFSNPTNSP